MSDRDTIPDVGTKDLARRTVRGGAVMMAAQAVKFLLQLGSTAVLARLLTPRDFGLIAMVVAITGFLAVFKDLGLSMATVQRAEITRRQISTLFWINVALSVAIAGLVAALAPVVAWFYGEPRLVWITVALSGGFILGGLSVQHQALLMRQMRFGALAGIDIAALAAGVAAAIVSASYGAGCWALVIMQLARALVTALGVWIMSWWVPGRPVRGAGVRPMLAFGAQLAGSQFFPTIIRRLDNVLIGWYWGAIPLGLYSRAYALLLLPMQQINAPASAVMLPTLSRLQNEPDRYVRYYQRGILAITAVGMPIVAFSFAAAEELILVFLGRQWVEVVPIFRALSVAAWIGTFNVATGWVYVSLGRTRRVLLWNMATAPVFTTAFVIGLPWGAIGVAVALSSTALLTRPFALAYCFRHTPLKMRHLGKAIALPAIASLLAAAVPFALRPALPEGVHAVVRLVLLSLICVVCYTVVWAVLPKGRQRYREAKRILREALARRPEGSERSSA